MQNPEDFRFSRPRFLKVRSNRNPNVIRFLIHFQFCSFHPAFYDNPRSAVSTTTATTAANQAQRIDYVYGQRGARKILCDGYTYICAKTNNSRKYWVCAKQRSRNCRARIITDLAESLFLHRNACHNHAGEDLGSRSLLLHTQTYNNLDDM